MTKLAEVVTVLDENTVKALLKNCSYDSNVLYDTTIANLPAKVAIEVYSRTGQWRGTYGGSTLDRAFENACAHLFIPYVKQKEPVEAQGEMVESFSELVGKVLVNIDGGVGAGGLRVL